MKKSVHILIDTSCIQKTVVTLKCDTNVKKYEHSSDTHTAQYILPLLEKALQQNNVSIADIASVTIAPGPGSFTGLRVGAVVGNTIGWLLDVPVNGKKESFIELQYGQDLWK